MPVKYTIEYRYGPVVVDGSRAKMKAEYLIMAIMYA
jgi:hypothetical protein